MGVGRSGFAADLSLWSVFFSMRLIGTFQHLGGPAREPNAVTAAMMRPVRSEMRDNSKHNRLTISSRHISSLQRENRQIGELTNNSASQREMPTPKVLPLRWRLHPFHLTLPAAGHHLRRAAEHLQFYGALSDVAVAVH